MSQTSAGFFWVLPDIARVSLERDENGINFYRICEPPLDDFGVKLCTKLHTTLRDIFAKTAQPLTPSSLQKEADAVLSKMKIPIPEETKATLLYYLNSAIFGWGKLEVLRLDGDIEDISCVGADKPVYIFHREYQDMETNIRFERAELDALIARFAEKSGKQISLANPIVDASLPGGARVQLIFGDAVSANGSAFTIRKFRDVPYSVIDLLKNGTFTLDEMVYLWFAVEYHHSILIIGGTASGKTTTLNAISQFIPPLAKIVTIEDTRELMLSHGNWQASVVPDNQSLGLFDLVTAAMRQRPEYMFVGEVRGCETLSMFQAMNTGHTVFSTFHAGDIKSAVNRLQNPPLSVPKPMIETLDIVLSQRRLYQDGCQVRRCNEIVEITGLSDANDFQIRSVYSYREETDSAIFSGVSDVFASILSHTGMNAFEFERERTARLRLLEAMVSQGITDFSEVSLLLAAYHTRPDFVMEHIGSLREVL